jgi:acetyl esterase/lipase
MTQVHQITFCEEMILDSISLIDCFVFVLCLIPQLLVQAGFYQILLLIKIVPFLFLRLPYDLVSERYLTRRERRTPFVKNATFFQDLVVRCVRYAFAKMPANVGRVFFSKSVALPFLRWRLVRQGYLESSISYQEIDRKGVKGLWIVPDPSEKPDIVIYYCHGGGFSMGSTYFYLEFLMAWITCLQGRDFRNPAVFALDYSLVPDATWPTQFEETRQGYKFLSNFMEDTGRICVSGDSAGGTLILSLLVSLNKQSTLGRPGLAVLISPWTHLFSELNRNTPSDYLDRDALHLYARQYVGEAPINDDPTAPSCPQDEEREVFSTTDKLISPGLNVHWRDASPQKGFCIVHGSEEVFAPGIQQMVKHMRQDGVSVRVKNEDGGIHAWPVVNLFLGESRAERLKGLSIMTEYVVSSMGSEK